MNRTFKVFLQNPDLTWRAGSVATGPDADASLRYAESVYLDIIATGAKAKLVEEISVEKMIKTNVKPIPTQPC